VVVYIVPLKKKLMNQFGPFVTIPIPKTAVSGTAMTKVSIISNVIIKHHVNASSDDV
jgi:hypothetical protein